MDDFSIAVGKRLKELREAKGMNQSTVARKLDLKPNVIWRWEFGSYCPTAIYLVKLADFFDCTVDELLGRTSNEHS